MKNVFRKVIAVLAVISLVFGMSVFAFAADCDTTTAEAIRFNNDGKLRIMHVTDTHLDEDNLDDSVWLISVACDREKPDIILLTGDIAMADTVEETNRRIDKLMNVFEERNIPVAVTFGNHDSENGVYTREELMAYYNTFDCSISVDDGELLPWCGTYNIPVLGSKDDEMKFNLWVFDSGDYDSEHHYSCVSKEQVDWYVEKSKQIEQENGKKINSLAFQHIIVNDVYDALKQVKIKGAYTYPRLYDSEKYYQFDPSRTNYGMLHEKPCSGYYNYGQFSAMVERGDVLAMFSGHDHTNDFGVNYKGIDIVNSLSTRYNGDSFSTQYGYRVIEVDENDASTYTTKSVRWFDFFNQSDMKQLRQSGDGHIKLAREIRFKGFFKKLFMNLGIFFVQMFTGRTVRYPFK